MLVGVVALALSTELALKSRIVSASIFKPGLALIVREVDVPAGSGEYVLDNVPAAIDGSFWYSSPDMVDVTDVRTAIRNTEKTVTYKNQSIAEYLGANEGKHVSLLVSLGQTAENMSGTIVKVNDDTTMLLKLDNGHLRQLNTGSVIDIDPQGLKDEYSRTAQVPEVRLQFHASAAKAGKVRFISLEGGAIWTSSYSVALTGDRDATIQGKAQVATGDKKFEDTDVNVLAGFPTFTSNRRFDLAAGMGDLNSYIYKNGQTTIRRADQVDPFTNFQNALSLALSTLARIYVRASYGYGGGGFGGYGGAAGPMGDFGVSGGGRSYSESSGQMLPNDVQTFQTESLFAYPLGKVNLERGDRLTRLLFQTHSNYKSLFLWDATTYGAAVQNILRLHNEGKVPWTGGLALITKENIPLAQLDMPFTAPGDDAEISMATPQDVKVISELLSAGPTTRLAAGVKSPREMFRNQQKLRITINNDRPEPITIELRTKVVGQMLDSANARIVKLPRLSDDPYNLVQKLVWEIQVPANTQKVIEPTFYHDNEIR